ncbi:MAG TPA: 23S rRNA (guanosine(2251)-2'-O)-methyltransferase RlmB [Roseiarcus sp.]|nr:23S rRNA (guanosine(2251)-2'-O)-methyltransferase RlmB [Roseiarcus sp.]
MTRKTHRRGGGFGPQETRPARPAAKKTNSRSERARPREESALVSNPRPARREARAANVVQIYGFHSVAAALRAPRRKLIRLYATAAAAEKLAAEIAARGLETRILEPNEIALRAPREAVHQGLLLEARPLEPIDISELPAKGLVVVLDQVTDPHNVGAILRTCAAYAVDALVTTERHSPEFTGALAKSASGGLEHVPICSVANLARALGELGDLGYWRVGLDSEAPQTLAAARLARPLALVLGAEDKGLRRLTREHCDVMARLDLPGAIKSLNVSNACAIALAIANGKLSEPA